MKDKEKQIEEMTNIIDDCTWVTDENYCESISCEYCHAKRLYDKGYRKIDKDSVVLSKEEYVKKICEEYENGIKDCKFHYEYMAIPHIIQVVKDKPDISDVKIEELIKQLGVEIKEN